MKYELILNAMLDSYWAIHPAKWPVVCAFMAHKAAGGDVDPAEMQAMLGAVTPRDRQSQGAVAVIPLVGVMARRANMLMESSGAVSTEMLGAAISAAANDPNVSSIVLDVDSPGGNVDGTQELADIVRAAAQVKPVTAVADGMIASAAYFVASQATEIVVSPSGMVGSIGVIWAHEDMSRALDAEGIDITLLTAGKYKGEGNPYEPMSDEAREYAQGMLDYYYDTFTSYVAKGRGVSVAAVKSGMGQGRMVVAHEAVRMGMADRIGTLSDVMTKEIRGGSRARPRAMVAEPTAPAPHVDVSLDAQLAHALTPEQMARIVRDAERRLRIIG